MGAFALNDVTLVNVVDDFFLVFSFPELYMQMNHYVLLVNLLCVEN